MSRISAVLDLQGRARRNALVAAREMQHRRQQHRDIETVPQQRDEGGPRADAVEPREPAARRLPD